MHEHDLRSGTCPSCSHNEIIEASPATFNANSEYVLGGKPLALTHKAERRLGGKVMVQPGSPFGQLSTYTCRRCGLTQWFAAKPEEVPIGPEHGTRIISGPPPQPFR